MPRRADPPAVQKAKGNPGRRKSAIAKREEEIARVAEILASAPADPADPLAPPAADRPRADVRRRDRRLEDDGAEAVDDSRLQPQHRPIFAMFCVYYAEFIMANEDVITNGRPSRSTRSPAARWSAFARS
jgi:hypothetical protein